MPVRNGESVNFELWDEGNEVDLVTLKSVKEEIKNLEYTIKKSEVTDNDITITINEDNYIVFDYY